MAAADSLTIRVGVEGAQQASSALKSIGAGAEKMGAAVASAGRTAWSSVESLADRFDSATKAMGTLAKAGAVLAAPLAAMTAPAYALAAALGDVSTSLNDLAKRAADAGTTASDLDTLSGALGLLTRGGVDAAKLLQTLDRRLGEAKDKGGEAAKAFKDLGLSVEALAGMSGTGRIAAVAEAMRGLTTDQDRARISAKLFEEQGQSLAAVWRNGGEALSKAAEDVREAGVSSNAAARAAEAYRDKVDLLQRRLRVMRESALLPVMTALTELIDRYSRVIGKSDGINSALSSTGIAMLTVTRTAEELAAAVGLYVDQLRGMARAASLFGSAVAAGGLVTERGRTLLGFAADAVTDPWSEFKDRLGQIATEYDQMIGRIVASSVEGGQEIREALGADPRPSGGGGRGLSLASSASEVGITDDVESGALGSAVGEIRIETDQELLDAQAARLAAEEQAQRESLDRQLAMYSSFADSTASLFGTISDAVASSSKGQTREVRAALRAMFVAQKIVAIAQIAVNTAQSMMQTAANLGFPAAIPGMVAAGVAGGVATAAVVAQTVSGLVGDAGTMGDVSEQLRRMGFTGRQTVAIERGEVVMPREASDEARRLADSIGVAADRAASGGGGGAVNLLVQVGGEAVEAVVTRLQASAIMRGDMTLTNALGAAR